MAIIKERLLFSNEVYDSASRPHPLLEELIALFKYKELIIQFVSRSIKTRYKRSMLGVVWTILNPLLTMVVLTLVFSSVFRFSVENYPVYVLSGLVIWGFFSSTTSAAMGEMIWSGSLLSRIYVPKSVFAVSAIGTGLVNLLFSLVPLLVISLVLGIRFRLAVLALPLAILLLAAFALGVGLLLATTAVYFADMLPVYEVILTIWMYATPIIYPIDAVPPQFAWILKLNPLYYLVEVFRKPLFNGVIPDAKVWLIATGSAVVVLVLGGLIFTAKSSEYAYRI
ncbi:MAG: ABC transporter permease [Anaerolineales bacterium]|jgi:ABC-2 type transport system permease protein